MLESEKVVDVLRTTESRLEDASDDLQFGRGQSRLKLQECSNVPKQTIPLIKGFSISSLPIQLLAEGLVSSSGGVSRGAVRHVMRRLECGSLRSNSTSAVGATAESLAQYCT